VKRALYVMVASLKSICCVLVANEVVRGLVQSSDVVETFISRPRRGI